MGVIKGLCLSAAVAALIFFFELAFFPAHLFQRAEAGYDEELDGNVGSVGKVGALRFYRISLSFLSGILDVSFGSWILLSGIFVDHGCSTGGTQIKAWSRNEPKWSEHSSCWVRASTRIPQITTNFYEKNIKKAGTGVISCHSGAQLHTYQPSTPTDSMDWTMACLFLYGALRCVSRFNMLTP